MLPAFEPMSCALLAYAVERACCCCRLSDPPRRPIPRARLWLRRNSEPVLDALLDEAAEPLLTGVDPALLLGIAMVLLVLRVVMAYRVVGGMNCSSKPEHLRATQNNSEQLF